MGLRIAEGVDLGRHAALAGRTLDASRLDTLSGLGLVVSEGQRLKATPQGRKLLNAVIAELAV